MASESQRKAVRVFRQRRRKAGIVRFEVSAPDRDKELIRTLARRLGEAGPRAEDVRAELLRITTGDSDRKVGGIWRALRASPLVGADIDLRREEVTAGRKVDL